MGKHIKSLSAINTLDQISFRFISQLFKVQKGMVVQERLEQAGVDKKESWKESFHLFREYVNNHEQHVGINMDDKGHSFGVSDKVRNILAKGEKTILVIKWQRT